MKLNVGSLKKIKIDNFLARLTKEKREKTKITKLRNR